MASAPQIEAYQGLAIRFDPDDGYWAENGCDQLGYADTIDELKAEIDDYWGGTEHGPLNGFFTWEQPS